MMIMIDAIIHEEIKQALRAYIPWDLRERLDGQLDGMATTAYIVSLRLIAAEREKEKL